MKYLRSAGTFAYLARPRKLLRYSACAVALLLVSGCGLLYPTSRRGESWVIYSDRGGEFLDEIQSTVGDVYAAYRPLFQLESRDLGRTRICLDGRPDDVIDHSRTPDLLGYYLPWFNIIHVDIESARSREPGAIRTVLFHEISHHFLNIRYGGIASRCWLNEGLASALECTTTDGRRSEYPLFNPILAQIAQRALLIDRSSPSIAELTQLEWSGFHESEEKVDHYALSWSLVYFVLAEHLSPDLPLRERIDRLVDLEPRELVALEGDWHRFLTDLDVTGALLDLAEDRRPTRRLTALWATDWLGSQSSVRGSRVLRALARLIDRDDAELAERAGRAFLRAVVRSPRPDAATRAIVERAFGELRDRVATEGLAPARRSALLDELTTWIPERGAWIEILIRLLEADSAEVRAASARALARIAPKPTITNPHFWFSAPRSLREREVEEWREWVASPAVHEVASVGDWRS